MDGRLTFICVSTLQKASSHVGLLPEGCLVKTGVRVPSGTVNVTQT